MIRSNSLFKFPNADIDVNAANIVLDGLGSAIVDQNGSDAIDDLSDNDGSFTIKSDRDLKTIGALRNDGSITLGKDSVLTTTGEYLQAAGSTVLEDTTSKLAAPGSRVRVQDGAMKGVGTVEPVLETTGGRVQPGLSTGILKVAGRYAPASNGTLEVEIGGTAPGSGYDQLDVGTTASLGGTLDIVTPSSFTPTPGQSFTILTCRVVACRSGQFNTVQGTHVRSGLDYQVRYNATDVTLELVNNPPLAEDQSVTTDEDVAKQITLHASDPENDSLTYAEVSNPAHGSLRGTGANRTYTPESNFFGEDSFTFKANDGNSDSNVATVRITANPVNDAPVAKDDSAATDEDTAKDTNVLGNDEDLDADSLSVSSFTQPSHGQVSLDNGKLRYEPALDYNGSDTFTYKAKDASNADSNVATVTIDVKSVNPAAPVITNLQGADAANEGETRAYTFQITDSDSSTFSFASGSPTCGGTGKGEVVGTPVINNDRSGSFECRFLDGGVPPTQVSVSVQVKDESQASSGVTSKIVSVSNGAPKIESLSWPAQVLTNQPVTFTGTHSDPAGLLDNPFTWQWSGGTSTDTNNSYVTKFSACGPQNVKATVTDKDGGTSAEASLPVRSYNGNFLPPLQAGKDNLVQKGQVVPVKISVTGCDGINLAGLSPYLQLFSGDPTTAINEADFIVPTTSVAADTGQTMRPVPDGYVYNLRVPSDAKAKAGAMYYIRVSPFGVASGQHMIISIQIRK